MIDLLVWCYCCGVVLCGFGFGLNLDMVLYDNVLLLWGWVVLDFLLVRLMGVCELRGGFAGWRLFGGCCGVAFCWFSFSKFGGF